MTEIPKDIFEIDFIQQNNLLKEKLFFQLDSLVKDASSLMDLNKSIYPYNNNLSFPSNNRIENTLKEYMKYNEYLEKNDSKDINLLNENILKEYYKITGISISRTPNSNLKIDFNFLKGKNNYYIILAFDKSIFKVVEINPKDINYKKYIYEINKANEITLFLCKLINYELIPHYEKNLNE